MINKLLNKDMLPSLFVGFKSGKYFGFLYHDFFNCKKKSENQFSNGVVLIAVINTSLRLEHV